MFTFGIYTKAGYQKMGPERRFAGARVAYNLLRVGDNPAPEDVRAFEDICITLRTANGTFRTTFRNRFRDVDAAAIRWMERFHGTAPVIRIQDRAASIHGRTTLRRRRGGSRDRGGRGHDHFCNWFHGRGWSGR